MSSAQPQYYTDRNQQGGGVQTGQPNNRPMYTNTNSSNTDYNRRNAEPYDPNCCFARTFCCCIINK